MLFDAHWACVWIRPRPDPTAGIDTELLLEQGWNAPFESEDPVRFVCGMCVRVDFVLKACLLGVWVCMCTPRVTFRLNWCGGICI